MPKIYKILCNPDGTPPDTFDAAAFEGRTVRMIVPTDPPGGPGKIAVETAPVKDGEIWRQTWKLIDDQAMKIAIEQSEAAQEDENLDEPSQG